MYPSYMCKETDDAIKHSLRGGGGGADYRIGERSCSVKTFKATTHSQEGRYGRGNTYVTGENIPGGGLIEYTRSKYFLICFVHF